MTDRPASSPHARIQAQFSDHVEGSLGEQDRRAVDEHLAVCTECRTELQRFRTTLSRLGGMKERAPRSFLSDIQKQIHERSRGRFFGRRRLLFGRVPFEWVSLAMIVAMLVYYIIASQGAPTDVTPGP
jgi:anti-sigma factor RsiW